MQKILRVSMLQRLYKFEKNNKLYQVLKIDVLRSCLSMQPK